MLCTSRVGKAMGLCSPHFLSPPCDERQSTACQRQPRGKRSSRTPSQRRDSCPHHGILSEPPAGARERERDRASSQMRESAPIRSLVPIEIAYILQPMRAPETDQSSFQAFCLEQKLNHQNPAIFLVVVYACYGDLN